MSYDARARGALCERCPLNTAVPVPPELRQGSKALLVGEGPGDHEVREGRPFVGPSGLELDRALGAIGVHRSRTSITNAILCPLPDFKMARLDADLRKENKRRQARGEQPLPHPIDCCRPRLMRDVADTTTNVITLGGTALQAFGVNASVTAIRGGPKELLVTTTPDSTLALRVLPTLHPAFVLRARRWTRAFIADLGRAFRWFTTGLRWEDPEILYRPSAAELRAWLEREANTVVVVDVETLPGFTGVVEREKSTKEWKQFDPSFDRLRYLGLCSEDAKRAVGIPFLWVANGRPVYTRAEGEPLADVLREFFGSARWMKGGHNVGYYDRIVIEATFACAFKPYVDAIGLHKMVEPELPHRLAYTGSVYTDAPAWKDEFDAKEIKTDADMKRYNGLDVAITALTLPPLAQAVLDRGQRRAAQFWHRVVQPTCVELHRNGMFVDQAKREQWDARLRKDARHWLKQIRDGLGRERFNPNSVPQVRDLFFDEWGLLPFGEPTEAGDPSTGDDTLRAFLSPAYSLTDVQKRVVRSIRRYRAVTKMRGTYVTKLRPMGTAVTDADLAFDEEESEEERDKRIKKLEDRPGLVLADGRIHSDWNAHGTKGWRISSSHMNCQNFPLDLRDMIVAPPGYVLVGCDEAQLELRMVAALAGAQEYLAAFNAGKDPHLTLCIAFFGDEYVKLPKKEQKSLRRFVKEFTYASAYRAGPETVHGVLTSSEGWVCGACGTPVDGYAAQCDEHPSVRNERKLLYPDLTVRETIAFHRKWLDRNPEIEAWWERDLDEFRRQGFLAEPVFGLRCDFLDGEGGATSLENEIANLKAQSGGSALVHLATEIVMAELPRYGARLINQSHDSLTAEVPIDHPKTTYKPRKDSDDKPVEFGYCAPGCGCRANKVARMMEEAMKRRGDEFGLPVQFLGEAMIGHTWQST